MVCRFIKGGHRVKLLPLPTTENGEELSCQQCNEIFNTNTKRRCAYVICDHIYCFGCVMESKTGCFQCSNDKSPSPTTSKESEQDQRMLLRRSLRQVSLSQSLESINGNDDGQGNEPEISVLTKEGDIKKEKEEGDEEPTNSRLRNQRVPSSNRGVVKGLLAGVYGKWNCRFCPASCTNKSTLGLHMRKMHSKERPFNCDLCNWCLMTKKQLRCHRKTHFNERPYRCPFCCMRFTRRFVAARHIVAKHSNFVQILPHHGNNSRRTGGQCQTCQTEFEVSKYSSHQKAMYTQCGHILCLDCVSKSLSGCTLCTRPEGKNNGQTKTTKTPAQKRPFLQSYLTQQVVPKEETDDNKDANVLKCPLCDFSFSRSYSLERHIPRFHREVVTISYPTRKKLSCTSCNHYFESVEHSKRRKVSYVQCGHSICLGCSIQEKLQCSQCPQMQSSDQASLPNGDDEREASEEQEEGLPDIGLTDEGSGDDGRSYVCKICDFNESSTLGLEQHLGTIHGVHLVKPGDDSDSQIGDEQKEYYCPECQEEFGSTEDHKKFAYSTCGHVSCLSCIWKAELGCGQCTTENAARWRTRTPSVSPTKSEITFRMLPSPLHHHGSVRSASMLPSSSSSASPRKAEFLGGTNFNMEPTSSNELSTTTTSIEISMKIKTGQERTMRRHLVPKREGVYQISGGGGDGSQGHVSTSSPSTITVSSTFSSPTSSVSLRSRKSMSQASSDSTVYKSRTRKRQASLQPNGGNRAPNKRRKIPQPVPKRGRGRPRLIKAEKSCPRAAQASQESTCIYDCIYCNKKFATHRAKRIHIQKVHATERRHECPHCGWRVQSRNDLQRHLLKHTKAKPWKCSICAAAFTRKYTLDQHLRHSHQKKR